MMIIWMLFYSIMFALCTNCFIFTDSLAVLVIASLLFIAFNLLCGLCVCKSRNVRLRVLLHGTMLLIAFCFSVAASIILHILAYFGVVSIAQSTLIHSAIYCVACHFAMFWNGIACVYLTSVQLGIKMRVVGAICGLIPVVNVIVLLMLISITYLEYTVEVKKEQINQLRQSERICQTKYPILFVHGVFFRDNKWLNYWGRIPKELEINGARCFYGNHQSATSVKDSAEELAKRIREIVKEHNCEKLNIIAHSKGGLDCRYAIAHCDVAPYVASLTTINTPHRGCLFAEWLLDKASDAFKNRVALTYNSAAKYIGDTKPDFLAAVQDLTADACCVFDKQTALPDGIYSQSVGTVMHKARSGRFPLNVSYHFVKYFDGKNDGLVGEESFRWGSRYIFLDLQLKRGASHADIIDLNRDNLKGFDVREFYVRLVSELKEQGL